MLRLSDDGIVTLVVFGGVAVVAGGVALVNWLLTRRRRRTYEAFCLERGYRFDPARPGEEAHHAATCRLFTEGRGRRWTFTIAGTSGGTPFTAFEYRSTTSSWKASACARPSPKTSDHFKARWVTTRGPSERRQAPRLPPALTHPTRPCCHPPAPLRTRPERPDAPRQSSAVGRSRTRTCRRRHSRRIPQSGRPLRGKQSPWARTPGSPPTPPRLA